MTNSEILRQVTLLGKKFCESIERQLSTCRPINGVQELGDSRCFIVPANLMWKYQVWSPEFFMRSSQINAVKKVISHYQTDPFRMVEAIEKMAQSKKAGDVRLNPNMLEVLHGILDDVKKVGERCEI